MFLSITPIPKKHRIKKWCHYCGRKFEPNGKFNEICGDCQNLSYNLGRCGVEAQFKPVLAKIIKDKYLQREKVADVFTNINNKIIEKQLWYEGEGKPYMFMKLSDLKDIMESEKRRLEE